MCYAALFVCLFVCENCNFVLVIPALWLSVKLKFRFVFWDVLLIVLMMEAARASQTSADNYFIRQYIPEDKSELHTRRRENFKSHRV
jgi:hypothetical protein